MNVLLLVATERGRRFAAKMFELMPEARFTVCTFDETVHEPRFTEAIKALTESAGHEFTKNKKAETLTGDYDLIFAVSWRYMIPKAFYEKARLGAYVFHDSLLPRYRGFSPTVWAMINGEKRVGASLIRMAEGVDEGDILDQYGTYVGEADYISDVMERITQGYLGMLERTLPSILDGTVEGVRQEGFGVPTYCAKWTPDDARIDWKQPAHKVLSLIRATSHPYPGAFFMLCNQLKVSVTHANMGERRFEGGMPGRVVGLEPLEVLCGDGHTIVLKDRFLGFKLSDTLT